MGPVKMVNTENFALLETQSQYYKENFRQCYKFFITTIGRPVYAEPSGTIPTFSCISVSVIWSAVFGRKTIFSFKPFAAIIWWKKELLNVFWKTKISKGPEKNTFLPVLRRVGPQILVLRRRPKKNQDKKNYILSLYM
jgi:hypothetical protein